ncbi:MAG: hypothetical protein IH614_04785 [Desulfuromonadales bacterium]|nr:hypothetical protein [Desulfuromonadales bacterium]
MKTYFTVLLILASASFGLQVWFYLAHLATERTRPWYEREENKATTTHG